MHALKLADAMLFLSTLSLRRATQRHWLDNTHQQISIHALLAESDFSEINTRGCKKMISIHALLAESDFVSDFELKIFAISIHALLAESDPVPAANIFDKIKFLSTLSLRRATSPTLQRRSSALHFYPRSPCGERPAASVVAALNKLISIHALLAESDRSRKARSSDSTHFYPRSPCGERLFDAGTAPRDRKFLSTLSLRRATKLFRQNYECFHFYPRSPCGERPSGVVSCSICSSFLSTLSLRRATVAPLLAIVCPRYFYPRSPCGERLYLVRGQRPNWGISIHALLAESDKLTACQNGLPLDFYPRSPCGERRVYFA